MKFVFSYIILFFQLTTLFSQEVVDKVIAVVGEKESRSHGKRNTPGTHTDK